MKKIFVALSAGLIMLGALTSCEDLLQEQNYGNPTVEDMMSNEANIILLVGQAYAEVKWVHDHWGYWGVSSLTSDECVCPTRLPGEHWADGGYWKNLNTHNWNAFGDAFKNIWNSTISGAVLCNKLITTLDTYIEDKEGEVYKQYRGELEVMRSYYYYLLFDCFGRIPYLEVFEDVTEPLMEPEVVWSHLVNCLERNAPNMPMVTDANRAANYGRVTQGFAYALLARLYLNAESFGCTPENICLANNKEYRECFVSIQATTDFYTNAVNCCDMVINAGSYSIEDDWFANFKIDNSSSKENIFVIVENGNGEFDLRYNGSMSNKLRIPILTLHYSHQSVYNMIEKPWNGFVARPSFMELYSKKDLRGPGPVPPAAPEPPALPAGYEKDSIRAKYEKQLEAEYHGPLKEYAKIVQDFGTQSAKQWGWFIGPVFDKEGEIILDETKIGSTCRIEIASLEAANWYDGARCTKYEIDKEAKYQYAENDFVLMRYADVLWMKEEAILRGGQGASEFRTSDFQKMLNRAMAYEENSSEAYAEAYPGVVSLQLDDILNERGREFAWECIRRRDLIRFNQFDKVEYVTGKEAFRRWFPIPFSVIEKAKRDENGNPIWTQNEGY